MDPRLGNWNMSPGERDFEIRSMAGARIAVLLGIKRPHSSHSRGQRDPPPAKLHMHRRLLGAGGARPCDLSTSQRRVRAHRGGP